MAKKFLVEITLPRDMKAGETFTVEVEKPTAEKGQRGQLAGIPLEDMTDDQLKREGINANSVLYKSKQRGAAEDIIAKNQARVDAVIAEKAKRGIGGPAPYKVKTLVGAFIDPAGAAADVAGATIDEEAAGEI
jgi:hypothetical protein